MVRLEPSGGGLIDTPVKGYTQATIQAVGFDRLVSFDWRLVPRGKTPPEALGRNVHVQVNGATLTASYTDELRLFPIRRITYLTPDFFPVHIKKWSDLPPPEESPYITALIGDPKGRCEWDLYVTVVAEILPPPVAGALPGAAPPEPEIHTVHGHYEWVVRANHSINRDLLKRELELRGL